MINSVGIIGMGALGILYGDILTKSLSKENVFFILDEGRIEKYNNEGVYCNNEKCDFSVLNSETPRVLDLIIVSVKYTALNEAITNIKPFVGKDTIIISLLNGVISEEKLIEAFGEEKVIYCVAQGMDALKLGNKLTYMNTGNLHIGTVYHNEDKLNKLAELFKRGNVPFIIEDNILRRMWSKLMLNVGVNQVVMVYEGTYKTIQVEGEPRDLMIGAMREVIKVANAKGIDLNEDDLNLYLNILNTLDPSSMPSMRQDGLSKRKSEKDLFSKTIMNLGDKYNIDTPINDYLYETITRIESKY